MTDDEWAQVAANALDDLLFVFDTEGDIEYMNGAAVELTGYSAAEMTGKGALDIFGPHHENRVAETMTRALETGEATVEADMVTKDGEMVPHEFRTRRVIDDEGTVIALAGIGRDITERQGHDRELERKNERLAELASILSHDLRNPLGVAKGRLVLAREECSSKHLEAADRTLDRMDELIEGVLTLVRQGERVTKREPIDLDQLAKRCWGNVETKEGALVAESGLILDGDPMLMKQMLENVFRNAVEHGGADVAVRIGSLDDGFYIEDDGPGIPESERENVFELGFSTLPTGTGLGLNIVERFAEAHSWSIRLTGGRDGGVRLEVTDVDGTS